MRGASALAVEQTREVFSGVHGAAKILFYVLAAAATLAFAAYAWKRIKKYRRGRAIGRWREVWEQTRRRERELVAAGRQLARSRPLQTSIAAIASNSTVSKRDRKTGLAHFFVFWGFITLFIGTVILTIDEDILAPISNLVVGHEIHFFHGPFYLVYSIILDVMGLGAVVGLAYLIGRRATHPPQLDYTRAEKPDEGYSRSALRKGDALFAWFLMAVLVTGFLQEGFRITATGFPSFETWSPVGWVLAKAFSGLGLGAAAAEDLRLGTWWLHAALALAFVVYIPDLQGHAHGRRRRQPRPSTTRRRPGTCRSRPPTPTTSATALWPTSPGRNSSTSTPAPSAAAATWPARPRWPAARCRPATSSSTCASGSTSSRASTRCSTGRPGPAATGPLSGNGDTKLAGDVIKEKTLWACTTCMACVEACPVGIEHVSTIVQLRRSLVDEGRMEADPPGHAAELRHPGQQLREVVPATVPVDQGARLQDQGRPQGARPATCGSSATSPASTSGSAGLSRTLATILNEAGVDFGILYEDERNSGNDVRRIGEEGLFEMLVEQNLAAFEKAEFDEIVTTDPHSLNTLRNEYPEFGLDKPVRHYTELLAVAHRGRDHPGQAAAAHRSPTTTPATWPATTG